MSEKKCCFLIPIHPPHYNFLDFLEKIDESKLSFDIYFILSYKSHEEELLALNHKKIYKTICMSDFMSGELLNTMCIYPRGIITFKKFFGLLWLLEKCAIHYDYAAVVDAEIEFINVEKIPQKFQAFAEKKQILGSVVNDSGLSFLYEKIGKIHTDSKVHFKHDPDFPRLEEITKQFSNYFWFSDIPIYDMSIVPDFFQYIAFDFNNLEKFKCLSIDSFDFVIYSFYLLMKKDYTLLNMKDYGIMREHSLESAPFSTYLEVVEKIGYEPLWVIGNTYAENKEYFSKSNLIMTYHKNDPRYIFFGPM